MWRTRAVTALLLNDVAGLAVAGDEELDDGDRLLARARRRAALVVGLDWLALLVLLLAHAGPEPFLVLGATERTVFTLGALAVAVHSGFRLGQLEKLNAVTRARRELARRDPEA